jgi:hypothetical protein
MKALPSRKVLISAFLAAGALIGLVLIGIGYRNATAVPLIRRLVLTAPNYPAGATPIRIVLFSDVHVHGPDMPPSRLARIVDQINALRPDIVIAAGDFLGNNYVGRHYSVDTAIAPLRGLEPKLGAIAVLGNNDYKPGARAVVRALEGARFQVLEDGATTLGPIAFGGLDGAIHHSGEWKRLRKKTYSAIERSPGLEVLIAHRSDEFVLAPASIGLVLGGHTHCGQIVLPVVGALATGSDYGSKYLCGVIREKSRLLVVTAGLGTSNIPIRFGAPPDMWLITIGGPPSQAAASSARPTATPLSKTPAGNSR